MTQQPQEEEEDSNLGLYAALLGGSALAAAPFAFKPVRKWGKERFIDPFNKSVERTADVAAGLGQMPGVNQVKRGAKKAADWVVDESSAVAEAGHFARKAKESAGYASLKEGRGAGVQRVRDKLAMEAKWEGVDKKHIEDIAGSIAHDFRNTPANLRNINSLSAAELKSLEELKAKHPELHEADHAAVVALADRLKKLHTSVLSTTKSRKKKPSPHSPESVMALYLNLIK